LEHRPRVAIVEFGRAGLKVHEDIQQNPAGLSARVVQFSGSASPAQAEDPRLDLKELIRVIRRRRASIFWTATVFVMAALLYGLVATPLFTASTQLLIDPRDRRIMTNEVTPEALAPDGGIAVVESQLLVITSDTVLRRVIAREDLGSDPEFGGAPTGITASAYRGLAALGVRIESEGDGELKALRALKRRVAAKRSDKAYVVDVHVTTNTADKSVRIADAIAQAYLDDQASARAAASGRASVALTGRLDDLRARVQEAENRVVAYKEQNKMVAAGGVLVSDQQLSDMAVQLSAARGKTAEARARYDQVAQVRAGGADAGATPEAVLSQTIGQLRAQYAEIVRQRAQLGAVLGPRHPSLANLDAQVRDVQKLINDELARITSALRNDLERAEANQRSLESDLDRLKRSAVETSQASVRLRELEREVEASRAIYQAFLVRARETREQQSIDSTNARIISQAIPPRDKSWPPRLLLLALALLGGVGIGAGVGLLREYFDERIYSAQTLQSVTGVPTLAVLPTASRSPLSLAARLRARTEPIERRAQRQAEQMIAAMRRLRDGLLSGDKARRARSLLVTSATEREDHSTVALNLALTAAADGSRVLLIDADPHRAILSKTLSVEAHAGLLDLVAGRAPLAEILVKDADSGLTFMPVGVGTDYAKVTAQELAQKLAFTNFDLTVIDGGGILAESCSRSFADFVDDLILVVGAGQATRAEIQASLDTLRLNVRKLRGTVLKGATGDVA
jgi:succinoglycan biosynthesis transport protein ExoP